MTETDFLEKLKIPSDTILALAELNPGESHPELLALKSFVALAIEVKKDFEQKMIPDSVYWDSMEDFLIWSEDYRKKTGQIGIGLTEKHWFQLITSMQVFRLGRLQYQIIKLDSDTKYQEKIIPCGEEILSIHIPAGAPLLKDEILDSLSKAQKFFKKYFNKSFEFYHCDSWLLSPMLSEILPGSSNILWFQALFDIVRDYESTQAEERVFGFVSDNPDNYPEITSLQKRMKAAIKAGKKMTAGIGVGRFANGNGSVLLTAPGVCLRHSCFA